MGRTTGYLTKEYTAVGAVPAHRITKWGAADGAVTLATDAASPLVGVNAELDVEDGEYASNFMLGNIAEIEFGGNVVRGDPITADAQGRGVALVGAGHIVGYAESSGALGTIGTVIVNPTRLAA